ncbi:hypothetical protein CYMTET_39401 [Cymbomonas tetramitiformis]|uniref:Uncharacterized protein n=1 Tax=Cymbomonas tetramitiformis TaxID=36881 RepID=A0AAE0CBL1_9CHLO|nr:hypothetical protein CYMTET_39401 [Cymbomonas tetramitiformis]
MSLARFENSIFHTRPCLPSSDSIPATEHRQRLHGIGSRQLTVSGSLRAHRRDLFSPFKTNRSRPSLFDRFNHVDRFTPRSSSLRKLHGRCNAEPPKWADEPVGSESSGDAFDPLLSRVREQVAELEDLGVSRKDLRRYAAGMYSDVKAVKIIQQIFEESDIPDERDTRSTLRKMETNLDLVLERERADAGLSSETVVTALEVEGLETDLTDQEKRAMGATIGKFAAASIDNALWSSVTLVLLILTLFVFRSN